MLSFFKLSRKKKEKLEITISKYVMSINDVIDSGFTEIKEFINENNNLDISPEIKDDDIRWFRIIIILGNVSELKNYFEKSQVSKMKDMIIEDSLRYFNRNSSITIDHFIDYDSFFNQLISIHDSSAKAMAYALFEKYEINKCQVDLFRRKNEPNPVFIHELKNLLSHFLWNWSDYLKKFKVSI